jgi:hypothetical protein
MGGMDDEVVPHQKVILAQFTVSPLQSQGTVGAAPDAERLVSLISSIQTEITVVGQKWHMFGIDGAVGAGMRTGFTTDAQHIVSNQHGALVLLLLKCTDRAYLHAMRIFTASADKGIGSQLANRANPVIAAEVVIAALNGALLTLNRTDIQVDKQTLIAPAAWFRIEDLVMQLFSTARHSRFLSNPKRSGPDIWNALDFFITEYGAILADIVEP